MIKSQFLYGLVFRLALWLGCQTALESAITALRFVQIYRRFYFVALFPIEQAIVVYFGFVHDVIGFGLYADVGYRIF